MIGGFDSQINDDLSKDHLLQEQGDTYTQVTYLSSFNASRLTKVVKMEIFTVK